MKRYGELGPVADAIRRIWGEDPVRRVERWASLARGKSAGPPYEPRIAASKLGLGVDYRDIDAAGLFDAQASTGSRILVGLSPDSAPPSRVRQNFILAHELAHFVLRNELALHGQSELVATESRDEEWLCNKFAAEFLMPRASFARDLARDPGSPENIIGLSKKYGVSLQAALVRAVEILGRPRRPFVPVIWSCIGEHVTLYWCLNSARPLFAGDTSIFWSASVSDQESAGYRLLTLRGKSKRLWCRTVSVRRVDVHGSLESSHRLLTICTPKRTSSLWG
jgi:hypothetical protein